MFAHDGSSGARVIEVDVRQQDVAHIAPAHAVALQPELECRKARRRSGIDDRNAAARLHDATGDGVRAAEKFKIDKRQTVGQNRHWRADYTGGSSP
jgi:hypothetical protein